MDAKERREKIKNRLRSASEPVKGTNLAKDLGVSRQVIVGDIAILRASGFSVYATSEGYLGSDGSGQEEYRAVFACNHGSGELGRELEIIVDNGGKVLDVVVEHPVYGDIRANLMLSSRRQVRDFLQQLRERGAQPLSLVTGGIHLHTVSAPNLEILRQIEEELKAAGFLVGD